MTSICRATSGLVALLSTAACIPACHRTDEAVTRNFMDRRSEFEELRLMFLEDEETWRVGMKWDARYVGLPEPRVTEYKTRLRRIGVTELQKDVDDPTKIWFHHTIGGSFKSASVKGVVWSAEPITGLVPALDDVGESPWEGLWFRRIDDHWYLFLHNSM